jgi:hypothetical protein
MVSAELSTSAIIDMFAGITLSLGDQKPSGNSLLVVIGVEQRNSHGSEVIDSSNSE